MAVIFDFVHQCVNYKKNGQQNSPWDGLSLGISKTLKKGANQGRGLNLRILENNRIRPRKAKLKKLSGS